MALLSLQLNFNIIQCMIKPSFQDQHFASAAMVRDDEREALALFNLSKEKAVPFLNSISLNSK